jgi:hypothetical protein
VKSSYWGLTLALGGTIGLLGLGLCVGIVAALSIFSRIVGRLRPTILSVRRELRLGAPSPPLDDLILNGTSG